MLRTPSTARRLALTPTQARRWVPDLHPLHDADVLAVDDAWQLSPAEGSGPLREAFVGGANARLRTVVAVREGGEGQSGLHDFACVLEFPTNYGLRSSSSPSTFRLAWLKDRATHDAATSSWLGCDERFFLDCVADVSAAGVALPATAAGLPDDAHTNPAACAGVGFVNDPTAPRRGGGAGAPAGGGGAGAAARTTPAVPTPATATSLRSVATATMMSALRTQVAQLQAQLLVAAREAEEAARAPAVMATTLTSPVAGVAATPESLLLALGSRTKAVKETARRLEAAAPVTAALPVEAPSPSPSAVDPPDCFYSVSKAHAYAEDMRSVGAFGTVAPFAGVKKAGDQVPNVTELHVATPISVIRVPAKVKTTPDDAPHAHVFVVTFCLNYPGLPDALGVLPEAVAVSVLSRFPYGHEPVGGRLVAGWIRSGAGGPLPPLEAFVPFGTAIRMMLANNRHLDATVAREAVQALGDVKSSSTFLAAWRGHAMVDVTAGTDAGADEFRRDALTSLFAVADYAFPPASWIGGAMRALKPLVLGDPSCSLAMQETNRHFEAHDHAARAAALRHAVLCRTAAVDRVARALVVPLRFGAQDAKTSYPYVHVPPCSAQPVDAVAQFNKTLAKHSEAHHTKREVAAQLAVASNNAAAGSGSLPPPAMASAPLPADLLRAIMQVMGGVALPAQPAQVPAAPTGVNVTRPATVTAGPRPAERAEPWHAYQKTAEGMAGVSGLVAARRAAGISPHMPHFCYNHSVGRCNGPKCARVHLNLADPSSTIGELTQQARAKASL